LQDHNRYYMVLDSLWRGYDKNFITENVIQSEIDQIDCGDYPIFYTYVDSTDLYDGNNKLIEKNYFRLSGIDNFLDKLRNLNVKEIYEQQNIIKRSLLIHNNYETNLISLNDVMLEGKLHEKINSYLKELKLEDPQDNVNFSYIDYIINKDSQWSQNIQGCDLFQGVMGIGIYFLIYDVVGKKGSAILDAKIIFEQTLNCFKTDFKNLLDSPAASIGFVHFPLSLIYFSVLAKKILGNDDFKLDNQILNDFLIYINLTLVKNEDPDYLFGATGTALLLLEYEELYDDYRFENAIALIGEKILKSSVHLDENRITWNTKSFNRWGGLAHGNASVSFLLFKLSVKFSNLNFRKAAIKALNYDQSLYNEESGHWDKTHEFVGDMHDGWASGIAGIGLSRFLIAKYYSNSFLEFELKEIINEDG